MGSDPMVKKFFSHYSPRPLQQPQMPDMKQVKRSVCNHIRHFSLLSFPPRQFRRATANPTNFFPFTITTFSRSDFRFPPSSLNQFSKPTLLTSHRIDLDPALFLPRPDVIFHVTNSILNLSTSFAPCHYDDHSKDRTF